MVRIRKTYLFSFDTTGSTISAQVWPNEHHWVEKNHILIVLNINNIIFINIQVK